MTLNLAEQLIRRLATDADFRQQLAALEPGAKRDFLDANGFRGVTAEWLQSEALASFKGLTKGKDKVAEEDAMAAVTAATSAAAATPAHAAAIVAGTPAHAASIIAATPSHAASIIAATPSHAASIILASPSHAASIIAAAPSTAAGPGTVEAAPVTPKPEDGETP